MTNAASTSNPTFIVEVGKAYPYPSHVIAPNFVTMKLSGKDTYNVWKTQILCLLKSHQMYGFIDGQFSRPAGNGKGKVDDLEAWIISDSLVKGWIFGSLSQEAVKTVVDHLTHEQNNPDFTAKDLWDELQRSYGPLAASTSNPSFIVDVGEAYPYPSVIGPNFVTVKLSGKNKYNLWEKQMVCLLKSHQMYGFIDGQFPRPAGNGEGKAGDLEAWIISDSLVKGWIFGSLSEEAAGKAVNHLTHMQQKTDFTAKDLWDELQRSYGPSVVAFQKKSCGPSVREQAAETKSPTRQTESVIEVSSIPEHADSVEIEVMLESKDAKSKDGPTEEKTEEEVDPVLRDWLYDGILRGDTKCVLDLVLGESINPWVKITNNGNTILHVAVSSSTENHELLKKLLEMTPTENTLLDLVNSDGSTLLHVAAIGGNIEAVGILVKRNPELLLATDNEGHIPLALSVSNMHINTSKCLFELMKAYGRDALFTGKSGEELVVLAISCIDFSLAEMIIGHYRGAIVSDSDAVLTALAQYFPRELNFWERRDFMKEFSIIIDFSRYMCRYQRADEYNNACWTVLSSMLSLFLVYFLVGRFNLVGDIREPLVSAIRAHGFHAIVTAFSLFLKAIVHPFIKDTSQVYKNAHSLLIIVCTTIQYRKNSSTYHQYYNSSIFEATRRNSSTFIRCIMSHFPDAIWSTSEDGHNFIQYSVINRSEKIYNLLYEMSDHKNIYKTIKDSSENSLLHLAAKLAPSDKLNQIRGAALKIQRELQWFMEVERFTCPLTRIQTNSAGETPGMVFIKEHKHLVIEGENWIKNTANSLTLIATLIITIVFAAAITVPGGNNQDSGIPIFTNNIAFTVFAISDAISLFTGVTSLLMFVSILMARFAEQDFLFKLPTKLIIGLTMLFLSTTAMIIAFGATLFLVFGKSNSWMLIPIGALTCLPITSFVTLQFPLIVELIRATYCGGFFVRERYSYFY